MTCSTASEKRSTLLSLELLNLELLNAYSSRPSISRIVSDDSEALTNAL